MGTRIGKSRGKQLPAGSMQRIGRITKPGVKEPRGDGRVYGAPSKRKQEKPNAAE